jgi:CDP-diacylglycerol--glycerol-3-phosphate 3-phosphatidyltransferase
VWLWVFTKPGSGNVPATRATLAGAAYCFVVSFAGVRNWLPNALTIARFAAIPVFAWLYLDAGDGPAWGAGIFFAAAALTDQLDGYLARRWHVESRFGKVADPLADRVMIGTAAVLMLVTGRIPVVAAIVILARDVILVLGYRVLAPGGYELEVTALGRAATWVLYASLGLVLVTDEGTTWPLVLLWLGVALSVGAGAQYVLRAWRLLRGRGGTLESSTNLDGS